MLFAFRARALSFIGAIVALAVSFPALGVVIPIGGAILAPAEPDPTGGVLYEPPTVAPFAGGGPAPFSGTLTTSVIKDDPSNPFAGIGDPNPTHHGLTFVYELKNNATSTTSLGRMTNLDFTGFVTDVSYQVPTVNRAPTSVDRSFAPGATIGWNFTGAPLGLGKIDPGLTSAKLVVQTNCYAPIDIFANVIDGAVVQAASRGPQFGAVSPEPGSLGLLFAAATLALRRRRSV